MPGRVSGGGAAALTGKCCIWDECCGTVKAFPDPSRRKIKQNKQKRFVRFVKNAHESLFLVETSCLFFEKW